MSEPVTETKAQRVERLKRELNPWAAYAEIERFARDGVGSIPPEWLGTYFRWWGIYTQGDGVGAVGGRGGEGRAVPYFMLRLRIPNGFLAASQLRTVADLTERHARGVADLTVRQNIQLHRVRVEDLPAIFSALAACGLSSLGTCGDVTRNITGCPLAGLDADEILDAGPLVQAATAMVNGSPEFYNLPRKYKVSITGCRVWCSYPRSTTWASPRCATPTRGAWAFRSGWAAGCRPDRTWRLAWTPGLATSVDTIVVLMGAKSMPRIAAELMAHGRPPDTPVALIRWGTTAAQETVVGTLADIVARAAAAGLTPPVLAVIGPVVRLRERLEWRAPRGASGKFDSSPGRRLPSRSEGAMKTPLLLVLSIFLAGAGIASAQAPKSGSIDLEYKQRAPALQKVQPRKIEEDTAQALSELDRQRTEKMLRESQPAPARRPDLDRDVTQGIQSRGLGRR